MASAEASARTVEAAVAAAARQLGLGPDEVEAEILEDAIPSAFGTIGRPARVRVQPKQSVHINAGSSSPSSRGRPSDSIRAEGTASPGQVAPHDGAPLGSGIAADAAARASDPERPPVASKRESEPSEGSRIPRAENPEEIEADTEFAADFVEGFLDALDRDGDITTWVDAGGGHVGLEGDDLDDLVGSSGETLEALQEVTRLAVLRKVHHHARVSVDVNGYRARQRDLLIAEAREIAERVVETGQPEELRPMRAADRKAVHDAAAATSGVTSESVGEEPDRRVVIRPE